MIRTFKIISISILGLSIIAAFIIYSKNNKRQSDEIIKAYKNDSLFKKDNLADLPLLQFTAKKSNTDYFVILLSGDGGWRDVINSISKQLAKKRVNVVGLNSVLYFNSPRDLKQMAKDLQRIIDNFSHVWKKNKVVLGGYSFSAEIMPFLYNNMDSNYKEKVIKILMLGATNLADFQTSPIYYYNLKHSKKVIPELEKIAPEKVLVICDNDKSSIKNYMPENSPFNVIQLNWGHQFFFHYEDVATIVSKKIIQSAN